MIKLLKKGLFVLAVLIILTIIALSTLHYFIKPNTLKVLLNKQLTTLTGEESRIKGNIHWQLFPYPGIKVTDITIGNPEKNNAYAAINVLNFNLQFTPLLKGQFVFNEVTIDGFNVILNTTLPSNDPRSSDVKSMKKSMPPNNQTSARFAIDTLLLTHGRLLVKTPEQQLIISDVQLGLKHFNLKEEPFSIQLKANLINQFSGHSVKAGVNFQGTTTLSASAFNKPQTIMNKLILEGQLALQNIQLNQLKIHKINTSITANAGTLILNPLTLTLYHGASIGKLNYNFASTDFSLNQTATDLEAGQLIQDLTGSPLLKGNLDILIHASGRLSDPNWFNKIQSKGNITFKAGQINIVDFEQLTTYLLDNIKQFLSQKTLDKKLSDFLKSLAFKGYQQGVTHFQLLTLQYNLKPGFILEDTLLLQTNRLKIKGYGTINLSHKTLENHLFIHLITKDKTINDIQHLFKEGLPFKISGQISKPMVYPDIEKISPVITRHLLKKSLDKPIRQLQQGFDHWIQQHNNL